MHARSVVACALDGDTGEVFERRLAPDYREILLHTRWARFDQRQKRPVVANTAIARELAGWCWSLAVLEET